MRKIFLTLALTALFCGLNAQESVKLYDPELDGMEQIDKAIEKAAASNKQVFIQLGGNWCGWCILFDKFVKEDQELKDFVDSNYVVLFYGSITK